MRKEYVGGAGTVETTAEVLSSSGVGETIPVNAVGNFPTGSVGPFVLLLTDGAVKEKVLCSGVSATAFVIQERGYDGTVAATFPIGTLVTHVLDAVTIDEANAHANDAEAHAGAKVDEFNVWTAQQSFNSGAPVFAGYKLSTDLPETYPNGVSNALADGASAWPQQYGTIVTTRQQDDYVQQFVSTSGLSWTRAGIYQTNTWDVWVPNQGSLLEPYGLALPRLGNNITISNVLYTVPAGKILRIAQVLTQGSATYSYVDSAATANSFMYGGAHNAIAFNTENTVYIYMPSGTQIISANGSIQIQGYLIDSVNFGGQAVGTLCPGSAPYTVPTGKRFVMTYGFANGNLTANGAIISIMPNWYQANYVPVLNPKGLIFESGTSLASSSTSGFVSGYLVDE